ncbi:MAG: HAMP domain-containing histidine kinase [Nitrospirae bacterium]|uniref:sensor histidine kinase n=1 Tax=Candidatus Magnetobacterium casense TaxID=1455061 RepID=UPI001A09B0B5|nr:HAMP domain-containing sensor histidine kinase [Candidatus Magnetobacterium casensis]MBF0338709.1 HAMP domain-containing histidine kinase [Nitrospirota bacterium]
MQEGRSISEQDKRLADYAMVFDVVGLIASYASEDVAIENIIHLLRNLFAPSSIIYVSIVDGQPSEIMTFPEKGDYEATVSDLTGNFDADYDWTVSGKGFRFKIKGKDNVGTDSVLGLMEIDGILFPDYRSHYLNLALTIASTLGLAISNSRAYQSLLSANKQIKESHDRLLKILENMEAIVYVADVQTYEIIFVNRYLKEAIGSDDIINKLCWNTIQTGQDGPCSFCSNNKLFDENGEPAGIYTWELQNTINKKWYYMQDRAIRWVDGRIVRLEIATDITKRKTLEKQLEQLNAHLEEQVRNKIDEIRHKEQMLIQQSKMAAMGEMIGVIAHQWKQPLNAISLIIQDIADTYDYGELNQEYIDNIIEASKAQISFMTKTIDDFRNFFKPTKNKSVFSVVRSIKDILSMFTDVFKKDGISIKLSYDNDNELQCTGYPNEFKQVILNLISNSKDAILTRRSKDTKTYLEGTIRISVQKDKNNGVSIIITDNGGGIPEDIKDRIFEAYFTTKPSDVGTGIGLYMSKTIIENNMCGRLTVRNITEGAEFKITMNCLA